MAKESDEVPPAFVEHVGGERRKAGAIGRVGGNADRQQQHQTDDGQLAVFDRPEPQRRVVVAAFGDARKMNAGISS